jgi:hypothetical protein
MGLRIWVFAAQVLARNAGVYAEVDRELNDQHANNLRLQKAAQFDVASALKKTHRSVDGGVGRLTLTRLRAVHELAG